MLRRFGLPSFLYEFPEDGGSGAAPEPAAATGGEVTPAQPAEPAGAVGSAPSGWSGPSEDEWYETQATLRAIADRFSGQPEPAEHGLDPPAGGFEWDPLADDADQQLAALLSQRDEFLLGRMQEMLSPVVQHTQAQRSEEAEARAMDVLADIETRDGAFATDEGRGIARTLADSYWGQAEQRFGNTPRAAEYALSQGAARLRAYEKAVAERAVNEFKASITGVAGAPTEPGVGGTGALEVTEGAESELEAISRVFGTRVVA